MRRKSCGCGHELLPIPDKKAKPFYLIVIKIYYYFMLLAIRALKDLKRGIKRSIISSVPKWGHKNTFKLR